MSIHTHPFARLVQSVAQANGIPQLRQVFVPQPLAGKSPEALRAYIEEEDPINRRPFVQALLAALTAPLTEADLTGVSFDRSTPRLLEPGTEENLQCLFLERGWTDGLPIVLPTEERVEAMLKGTWRDRNEVVGRLRPTLYRPFWEFTVEKVAVNAVMAGARPEYLPVILALAASGITARQSSTTSFATMALVNGLIRHEIGMNAGIGAMGPYNHANATIGRAYGLLSQNLQGGSVAGDTYMGSLGNGLAYSACFPENEEASPWEPFHVQHGYAPRESTVTAFLGCWYTLAGFGPRKTWQEKFRHCFRAAEPFLPPLICMDPLVARAFVELGFDTKQKLIDWCAANAQLPANEYWDNMWVQTLLKPKAVAGEEPHATRLKAAPDALIAMWEPKDIHIVVVGGETQPAFRMFGGLYGEWGNTVRVDDWR